MRSTQNKEGFYSTEAMEPIWESFALAMAFTFVQYMKRDECVVRPPAQRLFLCSQVIDLERGISSRISSTTMKHIDILGKFEATQRAFFGSFPQPRGIKEDKQKKRNRKGKLYISYLANGSILLTPWRSG